MLKVAEGRGVRTGLRNGNTGDEIGESGGALKVETARDRESESGGGGVSRASWINEEEFFGWEMEREAPLS